MEDIDGCSDSISAATSATASAIGGTTEELFRIWASKCLNPKSASLHREAKSFFSSISNTTVVQTPSKKLETKPSHEKAIAMLIQELEEVFLSPRSRVKGLQCVSGALAGCPWLSAGVVELMGKFLVSHVGPIKTDAEDIDTQEWEESIRDAAVEGLAEVVATALAPEATIDAESIAARLKLAETGVAHRCAEPEVTDHGYGQPPPSARVASGLSTMPRSRRSRCFDLLQAAVSRVEPWLSMRSIIISPSLTQGMVKFAKFTAACLHGESDPRCLLQLLKLLANTQQAFVLLAPTGEFPIDEFFDAVAPYYPIQFTPPPNNPFGITKPALSKTLRQILSCSEYDASAMQSQKDTMISLALGIVLERIVPPVEDGPSTIVDQLEGINDLQHLLMHPDPSPRRLELVELAGIKQLSDCLIIVHEQSSLAAAKGGVEGETAKDVANRCRSLVAKIALACEQSSNKSLWSLFVLDTLKSLSGNLLSVPSESRMAVAYMSCLCACGGPKALEKSLETGLRPLLDAILRGLQDDRDLASFVYGIGALSSSCRVAVDIMKKEGLVVHPHPLEPYTGMIVNKLSDIVSEGVNLDSQESMVAVQIAAARAMDATLTASPAYLFDQTLTQKANAFLETLATAMQGDIPDSERKAITDWRMACCRTLGGAIGQALETSQSDNEQINILHAEPVKTLLKEKLLSSILSPSSNGIATMYGRNALATACSVGALASETIIQSLLGAICSAQNPETQKNVAETISFVLDQGGRIPAEVIQRETENKLSLLSVAERLASFNSHETESKDLESKFGKSNLDLPPSKEDQELEQSVIETALQMIPFLLRAYRTWVGTDHLKRLASIIEQCLPPLSRSDVIKASVFLPFLGTAMENASASVIKDAQIEGVIARFLPSVCSFAMDSEFSSVSRGYAGTCLFVGLAKFVPLGASSCPVLDLAKGTVSAMSTAQSDTSVSLSMVSVLASAAANRGGASTQTSNTLTQLLIDLAVDRACSDPFSSHSSGKIDFQAFDDDDSLQSNNASFEAALAFGSVLSGDGRPSLSKQRFSHFAIKKLRGSGASDSNFGSTAVACCVLCSSNLTSVVKSDLQLLAEAVVICGLAKETFEKACLSSLNVAKLQKLILAAAIKLLCVAPDLFNNTLSYLVIGVMRIYALTPELTVKLLAMQALEAASGKSLATARVKEVKPAVVSILEGAMNDTNKILRQAGVQVRNAWCTV